MGGLFAFDAGNTEPSRTPQTSSALDTPRAYALTNVPTGDVAVALGR